MRARTVYAMMYAVLCQDSDSHLSCKGRGAERAHLLQLHRGRVHADGVKGELVDEAGLHAPAVSVKPVIDS
jgi:hypothetical protein